MGPVPGEVQRRVRWLVLVDEGVRTLTSEDGGTMLPPKLIRRLVLAPLVVVIALAFIVLSPFLALLALVFGLAARSRSTGPAAGTAPRSPR